MKTMSAPVDAQEKGHQRLLARVEDEEVVEAMDVDEPRRLVVSAKRQKTVSTILPHLLPPQR